MRKNLPLLALVIIVIAFVGGYLGFASFKKEQTPPAPRDVKIPPAKVTAEDSSNSMKTEVGTKAMDVSPETIEETDVPSVDPKAGELIVWGEVKAVDDDKRVLTVDQQMDDNSVKVGPNIPVIKDAIIRNKMKVISLTQVNPGDTVGVIVTKEGQARAVLVNY